MLANIVNELGHHLDLLTQKSRSYRFPKFFGFPSGQIKLRNLLSKSKDMYEMLSDNPIHLPLSHEYSIHF